MFVHAGMLEIGTASGSLVLGAGDTFTTPQGLPRSFRATSSDGCVAYVVRGGEQPGPVVFSAMKAA